MTRLIGTRLRTPFGLVLSLSLVAGLGTTAGAQTPMPQPVIDKAPAAVDFGDTAAIRGHLSDGAPGDEVTLQRRRNTNPWWDVSTKPVDEDLKVTFKRHDMKRTTRYRLVYRDEVQGIESKSDPIVVEVRPKLSLKVKPNDTFVGNKVKLAGRLFPKRSGREVILKQKVAGEWRKIKRTPVRDGRFSVRFEARNKGHRRVRVVFPGDGVSLRAKRTKPLTIYRRDKATWYGPGFYGNTTACGKRLSRDTLGVAHRTLPCGSKVSIFYRGRSVTVRVIDRGPYTHANWDLTQETAERIGFSGTDTVGVTR